MKQGFITYWYNWAVVYQGFHFGEPMKKLVTLLLPSKIGLVKLYVSCDLISKTRQGKGCSLLWERFNWNLLDVDYINISWSNSKSYFPHSDTGPTESLRAGYLSRRIAKVAAGQLCWHTNTVAGHLIHRKISAALKPSATINWISTGRISVGPYVECDTSYFLDYHTSLLWTFSPALVTWPTGALPETTLTPISEAHLSCPISQKPINRGGTPVVMQNRWSCTCRRAGPVDIFAFGGADVICIRNCWSVEKYHLWLIIYAPGFTEKLL